MDTFCGVTMIVQLQKIVYRRSRREEKKMHSSPRQWDVERAIHFGTRWLVGAKDPRKTEFRQCELSQRAMRSIVGRKTNAAWAIMNSRTASAVAETDIAVGGDRTTILSLLTAVLDRFNF